MTAVTAGHGAKLLGTVPDDMPPVYKVEDTKPSLCLAERFGEYGAHSCSSGDRCSSLAGVYFCT